MAILGSRPSQEVTEIVIAGKCFTVGGTPPRAHVPKSLMLNLRLSQLPEDVAISPLGLSLPAISGREIECFLYGFRDGSAWTLVEVSEVVQGALPEQDSPSASMTGLEEAVRERKEREADTDIDTEMFRDQVRWRFSYVIDIGEDLLVGEALERVERAIHRLNERSQVIAARKNLRAFRKI